MDPTERKANLDGGGDVKMELDPVKGAEPIMGKAENPPPTVEIASQGFPKPTRYHHNTDMDGNQENFVNNKNDEEQPHIEPEKEKPKPVNHEQPQIKPDQEKTKLLYDTRMFDSLFMESPENGIEAKLLAACAEIKVDMSEVFVKEIFDAMNSEAKLMGVPIEFFTHPLLSCVALMMNGASVEIHEGFVEPIVVNNLICSISGTNKTGAYRKIEDNLKLVQKNKIDKARKSFLANHRNQEDIDDVDGKRALEFDPSPHTLLLKKATEKGFISILKSGARNVMLSFEELVLFFSMLDNRNKNNEFLPIFLQSYNASDVSMLTQIRGAEVIERPFIQLLGFGQPMLVVEAMSKDPEDHLGTFSRMTMVCPTRVIKTLRECHVDSGGPKVNFVELFQSIYDKHNVQIIYQLHKDAREMLYQVDEAQKQAMFENPTNSELSGRYAKDFTKIVRVSGILCCIRQTSADVPTEKHTGQIYQASVDDMEVNDELFSSQDKMPKLPAKKILETDETQIPSQMKVAEMRSSLAERGLDTKGTKPVLVARLVEALEAEKSPEEKADEAAAATEKKETKKVEENGSDFIITKEDVLGAVKYIHYSSGILIQFRKAAQELSKSSASPVKEKKKGRGHNKATWYEDREAQKNADFVIHNSGKICAIWAMAQTDGGTRLIKFKEIRAKRNCWPQPSSSRVHTSAEMDDICSYFLSILQSKKLIFVSENKDIKIENSADDTDQETMELWNAIQAKHPTFNPFS